MEAVEDAALATTLDVSLGGVAFPCAHALELGTVLNLKISGADLPCTFTAEGEVRRCWRAGDQICVAVKFTTLEAVGRAEILKISGRSFG